MSWGRLDDSSADHPKFERLAELLTPLEAMAADGLWRRALAASLKHGTDGFLPRSLVLKLCVGVRSALALRLADALVKARKRTATGESTYGLWEERDGGYQIHDFDQYNRTANDDAEIKAKRAESGRIGGLRSGEARRQASASSKREANAKGVASEATNPVPSRSKTYPLLEANASSNGLPNLTLDGYARDAFRTDCPDPTWRGRCVVPEHPGPKPILHRCPFHEGQGRLHAAT